MVKKLLVLGDSFCHGIGTFKTVKHPDNTKHAFGKYLADYFQLEYVNLAEPGISVLKTAEIGYSYLKKHHNEVERVIIGWTVPGRLGIYSENSALQILPSFVWLGDTANEDLFVDYKNDVRFVTNKENKDYLPILPLLHRLIIENNFFDQTTSANTTIELFKTWLEKYNIVYDDFAVFGGYPDVKLSATFTKIMNFSGTTMTSKHPTVEEQKLFADLLIKELK